LAELIVALTAVVMNLLTVMFGIKKLKTANIASESNSGKIDELRKQADCHKREIETLRGRIKELEEDLRSCNRERNRLQQENFKLMHKLLELNDES
jgi:uncharacterized coiled-coil DUF342 family protein